MDKYFKDRQFPGRRDVLKWGGLAMAGAAVGTMGRPLNAIAAGKTNPLNSARNVIFLECSGAMSHVDCWDLKETRFTPKDLDAVKVKNDFYLSKNLFPRMTQSKLMDRISFVRSMKSRELIHLLGQYHVQTGRSLNAAVSKEIPAFGTVVAAELESQRRESDTFPTYVSTNLSRAVAGAIGSGFFPSKFTGLDLDTSIIFDIFGGDESQGQASAEQLQRRWQTLNRISEVSQSREGLQVQKASDFQMYYDYSYRILTDPRWSKVFQVSQSDKERYGLIGNIGRLGTDQLGNGCLLARNLLKANAGTRFVYICESIGNNGPWDFHSFIYDKSKPYSLYTKCQQWEQGVMALLEDLAATPGQAPGKSMLDETLVVATSEFGRTPDMNGAEGRDHYPKVFTSMLVGGGVKGNQVLGKSNADGSECLETGWKHKEQPSLDDLVATVYSTLGIDWRKSIPNTPSGRAYEYVQVAPIGSSEFLAADHVEELFI